MATSSGDVAAASDPRAAIPWCGLGVSSKAGRYSNSYSVRDATRTEVGRRGVKTKSKELRHPYSSHRYRKSRLMDQLRRASLQRNPKPIRLVNLVQRAKPLFFKSVDLMISTLYHSCTKLKCFFLLNRR